MMEFLLGALLLALFFGLCSLWLGRVFAAGQAGTTLLDDSAARLAADLDELFIPVSPGAARTALVATALAGALTGFALPGAVADFERSAIDQAAALNRAGDYQGALAALSRYGDSNSALAHNELGVAYFATGNIDLAEKQFQKAAELAPHYAKTLANLAALYDMKGEAARARFEAARAKQAESLPLDPEDLYPRRDSAAGRIALRCLSALVLCLAFLRLPSLALVLIRRRRVRLFETQLADALVMASNALRAGFSLLQALELTAAKSRAPLSQEFGLVIKEHRLGADLSDALRRLARRIPTPDTAIFANSVIILRETGGNLTEIFDTLSETIQERKRVQKKIKTMTAEGEMQAYFLAALPIVLGFILYQINRESMSLFFTTFGGWLMLMLMGLMEVAGLVMMLRIVRVKV
jgi:tight adherence protein B